MDFLESLTHCIGFSFFKKLERNRRTDGFCGFLLLFYFIAVHTVIYESHNMADLFQSTMMLSVAMQGFCRLTIFFLDPSPFLEIQTLIVEFYERCETRPDLKKCVAGCLELSTKVAKFISGFYIVCLYGPLVFSLTDFLLTGNTVTPYPIVVPYFNRHSSTGFVVNYLWQVMISTIVYIGYVQADAQAFLFAWQIMAYVDAFKCKLNDFSEELLATDENPKPDTKEIKKQLRRVIDSYTEIRAYSDLLKRLLTKPSFAIIMLSTYSVCTCGIALLIGKYYAAIGYMVQSLCLLLMFCGMGAFMRWQQERMLDFLWEFEWYKLPTVVQKDFLLFLMSAQEPFSIEPVFMGVMDLELYIKVSCAS